MLDFIGDFFNRALFGVPGGVINALSHSDDQAIVNSHINSIASEFDPTPYLEAAMNQRDEMITLVKNSFITGLIEPLKNQVEEIIAQKDDKQTRLAKAKESLQIASNKLVELKEQGSVIDNLKSQL